MDIPNWLIYETFKEGQLFQSDLARASSSSCYYSISDFQPKLCLTYCLVTSEASLKSESEISVNREIRVRPPVVSSGLPLVQLGDPLNYPI